MNLPYKNRFLSIIALTALLGTSAVAQDIKPSDISMNLTKDSKVSKNTVDMKGSKINVALNFLESPELDVKMIKGFYDEQSATSNVLIEVKNKSMKSVDATNVIRLADNKVSNVTIDAGDTVTFTVNRDSLNEYITDLSNKNYKLNMMVLTSLVDILNTLDNRFKKAMQLNILLNQEVVAVKAINYDYQLRIQQISNGLDYIISNFSENNIELAKKQLLGNKTISNTDISIDDKYTLIKILINHYTESLNDYRLSLDTNSLVDKNTLLEHRNMKIDTELKKVQSLLKDVNLSLFKAKDSKQIEDADAIIIDIVSVLKKKNDLIVILNEKVEDYKKTLSLKDNLINGLSEKVSNLESKLTSKEMVYNEKTLDKCSNDLRVKENEVNVTSKDYRQNIVEKSLLMSDYDSVFAENEKLKMEKANLLEKIKKLKMEKDQLRGLL